MMKRLSRVQIHAVLSWLALGALALLLWTLVLSPRIATAQELKAQSEQVQSANLDLVKKHQEILALGQQAPQLALEAQQLFSRMPQSAQLPAVFRQINSAAWRAGIGSHNVQVINATIPESVDKANATTPNSATGTRPVDLGVHLATMKVEVTVTGTDAQRMTFLSLLQSLDRGLLITGTKSVSNGVKGNVGNLTVTGTMFVLESQLPDLVANAQRIIQSAQQDAEASSGAS